MFTTSSNVFRRGSKASIIGMCMPNVNGATISNEYFRLVFIFLQEFQLRFKVMKLHPSVSLLALGKLRPPCLVLAAIPALLIMEDPAIQKFNFFCNKITHNCKLHLICYRREKTPPLSSRMYEQYTLERQRPVASIISMLQQPCRPRVVAAPTLNERDLYSLLSIPKTFKV